MTKPRRPPGNNFKPFEGAHKNDRHIRITENMMTSKAWLDLSIHARFLYMEFKRCYNFVNDQAIKFSFKYGRKLMDPKAFSAALDSLIDHGFIQVIYNGHAHRRPNIYGLSADWQRWPNIKPTPRIYKMPVVNEPAE